MERWIVLLRGINVGGHRRLPMADLREAIADLGGEDVRTIGVSGNVVLSADGPSDALEAAVERLVAERCGVEGVAIVVRSRDELAAVVDGNPFPDAVSEPKRLQVSFCSAAPAASVAKDVGAIESGRDRVAFRGREVYAHHPDGVQNSKLARALTDDRLGVTATARNWNTVTKLLDLADV